MCLLVEYVLNSPNNFQKIIRKSCIKCVALRQGSTLYLNVRPSSKDILSNVNIERKQGKGGFGDYDYVQVNVGVTPGDQKAGGVKSI